MADYRSLEDIFNEMDMNSKKVPLQLAEVWVSSSCDEYFKNVKYGRFAYTDRYSTNPWHGMTSCERCKLLTKFTHKLKEHEELLTQILCYIAFNYLDSKAIVKHLQDQFNYFAQYTMVINDSKVKKCIVDIEPNEFDMLIFGQILAPVLAAGYSARILVNSEFCHFFLLLAEILESAGLPSGVLTMIDHLEPNGNNKICIKNPSPDYYCPVIVFEDADLDSAVENIIQGAWRYLGKVTWSITHVLIQESVFNEVVDKLKTRSLKLKPGSRFMINSDISEETRCEVKKIANLEVFQPFKTCPQCFYIGWDPSDYEDISFSVNTPKSGVSLLPFRKANEGIALANKSHFGCASSLWTERLSTISKVAKQLEFGTVWVNCHGLVYPSISFESTKESKFPINGKSLVAALTNTSTENIPEESSNGFAWEKLNSNISASKFISKDIYTAVEKARVTQQEWMKMGLEKRFIKLCSMVSKLEEIIQSEIEENLIKAVKHILFTSKFSEQSYVEKLDTVDVTCINHPFGVIWIILSNISPLILEQLIALIFTLLVYGNSIIVSARTDELKRIASHICGIFEKCDLQNGLLSFVNEPFDSQKVYDKGSNEYMYCKNINRFITFGKSSCIFPLGQNVEFCDEGLEYFKDHEYLKFLSLQKRNVWIPKI